MFQALTVPWSVQTESTCNASGLTRWHAPGNLQAFARWDAAHFLHLAENGYTAEKEHAFFPGLPLVWRTRATLQKIQFKAGGDYVTY